MLEKLNPPFTGFPWRAGADRFLVTRAEVLLWGRAEKAGSTALGRHLGHKCRITRSIEFRKMCWEILRHLCSAFFNFKHN